MSRQEATPSSQVVYDVWMMTKLQRNKRIASKTTLQAAYEAIKPEHREEYVYILKWTSPSPSLDVTAPEPTPICQFLWGCLSGRVHANDTRDMVRNLLRSN